MSSTLKSYTLQHFLSKAEMLSRGPKWQIARNSLFLGERRRHMSGRVKRIIAVSIKLFIWWKHLKERAFNWNHRNISPRQYFNLSRKKRTEKNEHHILRCSAHVGLNVQVFLKNGLIIIYYYCCDEQATMRHLSFPCVVLRYGVFNSH